MSTVKKAYEVMFFLRYIYVLFLPAIIAVTFVFGEIIFCLGNGYYLFQVFDDYSVPVPLLIIALFQVIALGWVYGTDR